MRPDFLLDLSLVLIKHSVPLMKIAQCLEYPLGLRGGVSVLVENLMIQLAHLGHKIILVSPDTPERLRETGANKLIDQHIYWNPHEPSMANAKKLAQQLSALGIDIAHFHMGGNYGWGNRLPYHCPIYFLNKLKVPCFSTVHLVVDIFNGYCGPQKPPWFKLLALPLAWTGKMQQLWHTRCEIAVSQHDFRKLQRWYWPLRNRFTQIYHSRLSGMPPEAIGNRKPIILNVGHIAWRKGQAVLAEAFARIAQRKPEWILQLAGSYMEKSDADVILRLIEQHQLQGRILLLGERTDAFELMQTAAIYVQPSFWEALGLALQEAMFAGCACIGSRAGGIPELIQSEQNGLLFEPGNIGQLAQALEQLISDQSRREQLARAAIDSIQARGMTAPQMVQSYLKLYETARRQ
jgi:glycosyltransferase involved in cell wall biosynthesis